MKPIFNALEYDGINSKDQDIYITGKSVYNAPERDVEFIEIAGRSGDFALDKGRWKNQEVTYTAGTFGQDQSEFASKIRQFRNLLVSRYGYHRLVDTYNPEEYRLAIFKNAIEVEAEGRKRAGEFELVFNCNPKHYLMSGDSEIAVTSGEELFNPTPFDASPLLAVKGYGTIEFNGYTIEIDDGMVGTLMVIDGEQWDPISSTTPVHSYTATIDYSSFASSVNAGDDLNISYIKINGWCPTRSTSITVTSATGTGVSYTSKNAILECGYSDVSFNAFPNANETQTKTGTMSVTLSNGSTTTVTVTMTFVNKPTGIIEISAVISMSPDVSQYLSTWLQSFLIEDVSIESTISRIGDPTYIDCDLGEAYMIKDGSYIGLNAYIDLGSDLPTLGAGNNTVTFSNTVTQLKLTPRWWIL